MFKKMFKPKPTDFIAPMTGKLIPITEVSDPVFAEKTVGDGFAIMLEEGNVYSPVDGEVIAIFPTKHAIGLKADDRNQYLVHIGLNTVLHEGKGLSSTVEVGMRVKKGDLLVEVDHDYFKAEGVDLTSPILITNLNGRKVNLLKEGVVKAKEEGILAITV